MQWLIKLMRDKSKLQNELLGKLLRQAREDAEITQTMAAANLVRDQTFIARIESGSQQATFVEVEQFAQAYGKQLADFKTREQIETRDLGHSRRYAFSETAIADYAETLLKKRRQKRKLRNPKQRPRSRNRS
jgi:ribosome-binding protein aMBF1 (putative translation factor)